MPDDFDVSSIIDQAKDNIGKGPLFNNFYSKNFNLKDKKKNLTLDLSTRT
jgi:hypothetical protein